MYYWTTPNGHKITVFLEEAELEYRIIPVNIGTGEQFDADFLKIAPNNRIPAIVDHGAPDGPVSVFESGAILLYLSETYNCLRPDSPGEHTEVLQWLMWQMGGLGPMLGQNHHFRKYAADKLPYAIERYENETTRLYNVLNRRLKNRSYICGEYSIADIACYPWIVPHERQGMDLADFPHLSEWFQRMAARPAVLRAYEKGRAINAKSTMTEDAKKILFGQTDTVAPR